jgi:TPP-dependent indolepyruvate ferredoxin oxidoreductase alpha subunit
MDEVQVKIKNQSDMKSPHHKRIEELTEKIRKQILDEVHGDDRWNIAEKVSIVLSVSSSLYIQSVMTTMEDLRDPTILLAGNDEITKKLTDYAMEIMDDKDYKDIN